MNLAVHLHLAALSRNRAARVVALPEMPTKVAGLLGTLLAAVGLSQSLVGDMSSLIFEQL
jgi:hypothetical protein